MSALYETLGVRQTATNNDIKRAYRKLAMQYHPDKGGDSEQFQKITAAYEILSDENKKKRYDMLGDIGGLDNTGGDFIDPMHIFKSLFKASNFPNKSNKASSVVFELHLTLEELFTGITKNLKITKQLCCFPCRGKGYELTNNKCTCQGKNSSCNHCLGGYIIKGFCLECKGKKLIHVQKLIQVTIPAATETNHIIVLTEEGDGLPDVNIKPGDLHVKIMEKPHPLFERCGIHLFHKMNITFAESIVGFHQTLVHLSGKSITVQSENILSQKSIWIFRNHGIQPSGNLFIQINIIAHPSILSPSVKKQIAEVLEHQMNPIQPFALPFDELCELSIKLPSNPSNTEHAENQNKNGCPIS